MVISVVQSAFLVATRGPCFEGMDTPFVSGVETYNSKFGLVSIPGGKLRSSDKSLVKVACREFKEETGFVVDPDRVELPGIRMVTVSKGRLHVISIFKYVLEPEEFEPAVCSGFRTSPLNNPLLEIRFRTLKDLLEVEVAFIMSVIKFIVAKNKFC